jgi:hypothetical protein
MSTLQVPAIQLDGNELATITRWGTVGGFTFRSGDRLILGPVQEGTLCLLRPSGYGWPMLGRSSRGALLAEPGRVPASPRRWSPVGGVHAVERALERAVVDLGNWWVCVQEPSGIRELYLSAPEFERLLRELTDGDEAVAISGALTLNEARRLLPGCPSRMVRLCPERPPLPAAVGTLVDGPWPRPPARVAPQTVREPPHIAEHAPVQLQLFTSPRFRDAG